MLSALLFGLIASSALVIGGVIVAYQRPPERLVAVALAFASGALITALATDLFAEPFRAGGALFAGIGFLTGAAAFVLADTLLDRYMKRAGGSVSGFAILAGVILDGIPENMALGVSLLQTSWTGASALLAASFASNLPEALGGEHERLRPHKRFLHRSMGRNRRGPRCRRDARKRRPFERGRRVALVLLTFAGGAVLASLADTLIPDAYREGSKLVAFTTAAGFFVSLGISEL